ncbi:MAG: CaiB/BaiF CoA transferase family protein [Acidimicrobiales bacterium]
MTEKMAESKPLPLEGIRVLDLTQALAGPYCTMVLADLGADVLKVEAPGKGDDARHWGPPFVGSEAAYFLAMNRNKRSLALDLKSEGGRATAQAIAARCDVVVENWSPGTAERLGVGPALLREANPRLVYCSLSGYGQDRPDDPGYDQIIQGDAGLMSLTGEPQGPPTRAGIPIADLASGMFAAHAILAVLLERERTGQGRHIDVAMFDSVVAMLSYQATQYLATGQSPERVGNMHATIAPYALFATSDGHVNICVGNDAQWQRLCSALGLEDLGQDKRFSTNALRVEHKADLYGVLRAHLGQRSTEDVLARLRDAQVPSGRIRDLDELFSDPRVHRRGLELRASHDRLGPLRVPGGPWKLDGVGVQLRALPPLLGEHTEEVLRELGIDGVSG